eukprot:CAMPEP_0184501694 /NCGR_PEP_ID=MMETSP0113_2-20130426/48333_1 /TAXON_ID=91329 /ORGANISM="Norrisiella sphaerica, Strain BC52" /LENGTH=1099 /DNA_ID=CAMNT_0026890541 /DNA_START=194 /DNA_END=3493 /DNA_ORIENTATION=+
MPAVPTQPQFIPNSQQHLPPGQRVYVRPTQPVHTAQTQPESKPKANSTKKLNRNAAAFVPKKFRKSSTKVVQSKETAPVTAKQNQSQTEQKVQAPVNDQAQELKKASNLEKNVNKSEGTPIAVPKATKPQILEANTQPGRVGMQSQVPAHIPPRVHSAPLEEANLIKKPFSLKKPIVSKKKEEVPEVDPKKEAIEENSKLETCKEGDEPSNDEKNQEKITEEKSIQPSSQDTAVEAVGDKTTEKAGAKDPTEKAQPKESEQKEGLVNTNSEEKKGDVVTANGVKSKPEAGVQSSQPTMPKPVLQSSKPLTSAPMMPQPKRQQKKEPEEKRVETGPPAPRPKKQEPSRPQLPKPKRQPLAPQPRAQTYTRKPKIQESADKFETEENSSPRDSASPKPEIKRYQPKKISTPAPEVITDVGQELRFVYERENLLSYRDANRETPEAFPLIMDVKKRLNERASEKRAARAKGDSRRDQRGGRNDRNSRNDGRRDRHGNRRRGGREPKFLPPVEKLKKSENRFRVGAEKLEKTDENEKTENAFRRVLNKICPENFQVIVEKVVSGSEQDLDINNRTKLDMAATLTFEKSIAESVFCKTYAQFCLELYKGLPSFDIKTSELIPPEQAKKQAVHDFRRVILSKCQQEFTAYTDSAKSEGEVSDDPDKAKKRVLGTIRLIGELYIRKMLSLNIIKHCFKLLISTKPIRPDFIQALCRLLETIGKQLEDEDKEYTSGLFREMERISESDELDFRHKFMVKDSIELRDNFWVPRIKKTEAMTKKEFQKQVEKEEAAAAARAAGTRRFPRQNSRPQGSSKTLGSRKKSSDSEWSTAGGSGSRLRKSGSQDIRFSEKGGRRKMATKRVVPGRQRLELSQVNNFSYLMSAGSQSSKPEPTKSKSKSKEIAQVSPEQASKKIDALLDEYFGAKDKKEVVECINELGTPLKYGGKIVSSMLLKSVEKKGGKAVMGDLILHLSREKILSKDDIEDGYSKILKDAEDIAMDNPLLCDTIGDIYGKLICESFADISFISEKRLEHLIEWGDAAKLVFGMLKAIREIKGVSDFVEFYKSSGFKLVNFMRPRNKTPQGTINVIKDKKELSNLLCLESLL